MSGRTESRKRSRSLSDSFTEHKDDGRFEDSPTTLRELMRQVTEEARIELSEAVTRELKEKRA